MANFCYVNGDALSDLKSGPGEVFQIGIRGSGPRTNSISIIGPPIVMMNFPPELATLPLPDLQIFELMVVGVGQTTLQGTSPYTDAPFELKVTCLAGDPDDLALLGLQRFYHGTSLDKAKELLTMDLTPQSVPEAQLLGVNEYTDFGKGFYTHPEESKFKAVEWAKRRNDEWGVVRFTLTADEFSSIRNPPPLYFPDKFRTRPSNAPKLDGSRCATWIEFVEFNRHVRRFRIQRPKDNDWTADYAWMRGPIWGRADSKLPGAPGLPERYHQINWGAAGLNVLNTSAAKQRRFLFTKRNEGSI